MFSLFTTQSSGVCFCLTSILLSSNFINYLQQQFLLQFLHLGTRPASDREALLGPVVYRGPGPVVHRGGAKNGTRLSRAAVALITYDISNR